MSQQHDEDMNTGSDDGSSGDKVVHALIDDKLEQVSASLLVFVESASREDIEAKSNGLMNSYLSNLRAYATSKANLPLEMVSLYSNNMRLIE